MQVFDTARRNMVEGQIKPNKVSDPRLLNAFLSVPREAFVPDHLKSIAYIDQDLALGNNRFLLEPAVLAQLLQAAELVSTDIILDVGCGSGYASAVMGALAGAVIGIDEAPESVKAYEHNLAQLGVLNASALCVEELAKGYENQGPYDVILINGAVVEIPQALLDQLSPRGRLITVLNQNGLGRGVLLQRSQQKAQEQGLEVFVKTDLFDAATSFLAGFQPKESFVF